MGQQPDRHFTKEVTLGSQIDGSRVRQNQALAARAEREFLGKLESALWAVPLLIPVSNVISCQERPWARRRAILAASTAFRGRRGATLSAGVSQPGLHPYNHLTSVSRSFGTWCSKGPSWHFGTLESDAIESLDSIPEPRWPQRCTKGFPIQRLQVTENATPDSWEIARIKSCDLGHRFPPPAQRDPKSCTLLPGFRGARQEQRRHLRWPV